MSDAAAAASAGALLKAAREKQGLHIAALAAAIKVTPRKLEALEANRLHELPDATFTRALAQTICRTLKVDARPVLELLPPAGVSGLDLPGGKLNTPFRDRPGREDPRLARGVMRPMIWAAALLVVATAVVLLVPDRWGDFGMSPSTLATAPATAPAPAAARRGPTDAAPAPPDSASAAAVSAAGPAAVGTAASEPAAAASQPVAETVYSAPPATAGAPAAAGILQLSSSEGSWIEVRDVRNRVLFSRTVVPGESVGLDGTLPLRLTVGNAAAAQVAFKGQQVDLAPRTRENIARFELR